MQARECGPIPDRHSFCHATENWRKTRPITAKCTKSFRDRSVEYQSPDCYSTHPRNRVRRDRPRALVAAHLVVVVETRVAEMLSVPVFIVMVGMTVLIAGSLESISLASLRPLLLLQFLLLAGFLDICVPAGPAQPSGAYSGGGCRLRGRQPWCGRRGGAWRVVSGAAG
jgi:hypothetical protein